MALTEKDFISAEFYGEAKREEEQLKYLEERRNGMVHITFEYRDELSGEHWNQQECIVRNIQECKDIYGLDECEYRILKVEEVN